MDFKPFKIGKYLLLERLATGGMAEVYRAKASGAGGFEKQLAIKRILPTYSTNEEFRRMFEYEARLSSMLTHANIVQIYDFVKSGDTYLLAMEYVDGKNLRQFVNKARKGNYFPPIEFGVYIINEVCKGLEYAHKKKDDLNGRPLNIIHRDMSPQNIMLSYDGAVKIVDFGIAKAKDRVDETRSGVIKGKFGYMSPEQANGEAVDHRTDIFSTGIILYELLTGRRLFAAENDMATLKLIQECVIPPANRQNPKITPELEKMLMKGLTKDLKLRYQDAGLFHRNLQEFLNKYFPSFTQKEAADILQRVFREEIENEKKRFEQIHRQSIPFSQGEAKIDEGDEEWKGVEDALDGSITKSESSKNSAVTFVDEAEPGIPAEIELSPEELAELGSLNPSGTVDPSHGGDTQIEQVFEEEERESPPTEAGTERQSISELIVPNQVDDTGERSSGRGGKSGKTGKTGKTKVTGEDTLFRDEKMPVINTPTPTAGGTNPRRRTNQTPSSGILLSTTNSGQSNTIRRRDRSLSAITQMGTLSNQESNASFSLEAPTDSPSVRSIDPGVGRGGFYPERDDYFPRRRRSAVVSFLMFCGVLAATVYLYRLYLNGQVPELMRILAGRGAATEEPVVEDKKPAPVKTPPSPTAEPAYQIDRRPGGDCSVRIDSDPAGARVYVQGQERGTTSTSISAPCNQAIDLTLRLEGYESLSENVAMRDKMARIYKTLKKIPSGTLELVLNRNAKIYIEGNLVTSARAEQKVEIPLRARKTKVRFVNEVFNIDVEREYVIEADNITRDRVQLDDPSGRKKRLPAKDGRP